jgi:hypothetical protein
MVTRKVHRPAPRSRAAHSHRARRRNGNARRRASGNSNIGSLIAYGALMVVGSLAVASLAALILGEEYPAVRRELEAHDLPSRLPVPARNAIAEVPGMLHRLRDELDSLQAQVRHYFRA